jgi:hypothetical protein
MQLKQNIKQQESSTQLCMCGYSNEHEHDKNSTKVPEKQKLASWPRISHTINYAVSKSLANQLVKRQV